MNRSFNRSKTMKTRLLGGMLGAVTLLVAALPTLAEDIDLFVQPAAEDGGAPNVLILLDNTGNWGRDVPGPENVPIWTNEVAAIIETLEGLPLDDDGFSARFRLGLMMFTETGDPNNNVDGAYVRAAIRDMNADNKAKYIDLFNELEVVYDRSNSGKAGLAMAEAYKYFNGDPPVAGNLKYKTDFTSNFIEKCVTTCIPQCVTEVDPTTGLPVEVCTEQCTEDCTPRYASNAVYSLPDNALNQFAGSPYNRPAARGTCGRNYIIYISNGAAQDSANDNQRAAELLAAAAQAAGIDGATSEIPISPTGSQRNMADEWSRFLHRSEHEVVTYTVDVDKAVTGQGPGWSALLKSMARVSSGRYFDVSSGDGGAEIADALGRIFSEVLAVNSVFASVSLPVSVNTQDIYLNQLYVGMFRPDGSALPRWHGNLKQYKLGLVDNRLRTLDADDQSAINAQTAFINECARSYWSSADSYWSFDAQGDCLAVPNSDNSNAPDGNIVQKGAQAQKLRAMSAAGRVMKTCVGDCAELLEFDASLDPALLGAVDAVDRDLLVGWHRGKDNKDPDEDGDLDFNEMRPSAHGDVIHSKPVAINFEADPAQPPRVVVFYGANDGNLRAINGNRTTAFAGVEAGSEFWSFVPPEFFPNVKRLRDNDPKIEFTGSPDAEIREPKPYGMDGPINAYVDDENVWIQATMRRGGRTVYAFDVSGIAGTVDPDGLSLQPELMWKIGCDDTGCVDGFEDIGQTWSAPRNLKTAGYTASGEASPMLIMGGGYDPCEDIDPSTCDENATGRYIYLLDAESGALLKTFETDRPVVGDVFVVPDKSNPLYAAYVYAADMGGNVYRISGPAGAKLTLSNPESDTWVITKVASLGCDDTAPCNANRKFMFSPDVVEDNGIYYLLVGSGDREKPVRNFAVAYDTVNYFFMLKDNPQDPSWLSSEQDNCGGLDIICLDSLVFIDNASSPPEVSPEPEDLASAKGWYLGLYDHEQVVTASITVFGVTTFSTHTPTPPVADVCTSNLGTARVYNVRFRNAAPPAPANNRDGVIAGGGLPPSPVAGQVTLDNGVTVPFIIGADPASPLEAALPTPPSSAQQPKAIMYWFIDK